MVKKHTLFTFSERIDFMKKAKVTEETVVNLSEFLAGLYKTAKIVGKHFAKEDPWSWFRYAPHSMTLDINGDCYCFTAEYPSNVTEYVRNAPEWNIEIEV